MTPFLEKVFGINLKIIISELDELWNYSKDFVSHKFKKEAKRLNSNFDVFE